MVWPVGGELVLVDFETTGVRPGFGDRVVEYAYIVIGGDGNVQEKHESLIFPGMRMPQAATRVNGITDYMLQGQPGFSEAGAHLWRALENRIMVAHNARFDLSCLVSECRYSGWRLPTNMQVIDSLKLAKSVWRAPNHKLTTLADLVGHRGGDAHRAMADVEAMYSVLRSLFSQFSSRFQTTQSVHSVAGVPIPQSNPRTNFSNKAVLLQQAIDNHISVTVQYNSNSSGISTRTITPESVYIHANGAEYFDGYCHNRRATRSFRIDRIMRFLS